MQKIVNTAFPKDDPSKDNERQTLLRKEESKPPSTDDSPPWDELDVEIDIESIKPNKASGLDLIKGAILKNGDF